jgi:hypothetical protein
LLKVVRRVSYPYLGYLFLLLGFAMLGLFVAALAYRSDWAVVAGVALAGTLVAAVVGFRAGAAKLARSRDATDPGHNVSIWSVPLRQDQIDQYLVNYRGGHKNVRQRRMIAVAGTDEPAMPAAPRASRPRRTNVQVAAAPSRLSA